MHDDSLRLYWFKYYAAFLGDHLQLFYVMWELITKLDCTPLGQGQKATATMTTGPHIEGSLPARYSAKPCATQVSATPHELGLWYPTFQMGSKRYKVLSPMTPHVSSSPRATISGLQRPLVTTSPPLIIQRDGQREGVTILYLQQLQARAPDGFCEELVTTKRTPKCVP